jgi:diguanylate cyclase (GGDEF)-like protein
MTLQLGLVLFHAAVALSALGVLGALLARRQVGHKPWLSGLLVAAFLYAFGYALELAGETVGWVLVTYRIQHLAIAFAPALIVLVAFEHGAPRLAASRALRTLLLGVSAAIYVVVATQPWHRLYHVDPRMDLSGPLPVITFERGPLYDVVVVYAALALLVATTLFVRVWRRSQGTERTGAAILVAASVLPWLGSVLYLTGRSPWGIDTSPAFLVFTSALLYLGIVRDALVDVVPVARELVFERMRDAVVVVDPGGVVVDRNQEGAVFLASAGKEALARLATRPAQDTEDAEAVHVDGRSYDARAVDLSDRRGAPLGRAIVIRDVTRQAQLEATLRALATTDGLTGLANRRHFLDQAERDVAQARRSGLPFGIAIFDVDAFKAVNDAFGHHVGDDVLRAVAAATYGGVRAGDVVGRYGGEEFAVALPDLDPGGAAALGERLREGVAAIEVPAGARVVRVTVSVGVAVGQGADLDLESLLIRADAAQYRAKQAGGDRVVVDDAAAVVEGESTAGAAWPGAAATSSE